MNASPLRRIGWALKHRLRRNLRAVVHHSGMPRRLGRFTADRRIVLGYHTVDDQSVPTNPNSVLHPSEFRRQMEVLRASHRPVVSLSELLQGAPGVALTFDDGYRGCLEHVAPILEEYGFPATFFVCPGFIDDDDAKWDDLLLLGMDPFRKGVLRRPREEVREVVDEVRARRPETVRTCADALLDWDGLRALAERGFEIQSHTMRHYFLAAQSPELQRRELLDSKRRLEEELGTAINALAYPFGFPGCFDAVTRRAAQEAGYDFALEQGDRYVVAMDEPLAVPRFGMSARAPAWRLELILSGFYF